MTPKTDSASGCHLGDRALNFDPDSDPEQEISVWTEQHQGENTFRIPLPKSTKWTHSHRKNALTYPSKQSAARPIFLFSEQLHNKQ